MGNLTNLSSVSASVRNTSISIYLQKNGKEMLSCLDESLAKCICQVVCFLQPCAKDVVDLFTVDLEGMCGHFSCQDLCGAVPRAFQFMRWNQWCIADCSALHSKCTVSFQILFIE
jgi:hypothetical protein